MAPQIIGHSAIKLFANGNFYKKNKSGNFFRGHFPASPRGGVRPFGVIRPSRKIRGAALSDVRWENFSRGPTVSGPKPGQGAPPRDPTEPWLLFGGPEPPNDEHFSESFDAFTRIKPRSVDSRADAADSFGSSVYLVHGRLPLSKGARI